MRKILVPLFWLILFANIALLLMGNYFYKQAVYYDTNKEQDFLSVMVEQQTFDYDRFQRLRKEKISITSDYGYEINGILLHHWDLTQNTVILSHGLAASKWHMMRYADLYLDRGFNVLIYDLRNHGDSGGKNVSYGYFEKYDLEKIVRLVRSKFPDGIIGLQGESMGAATSLQHAFLNTESREVSFYVADCGYSDLKSLFTYRLKEDYGLPNIMILEYASLVSWIRSGFRLKQISPRETIDEVETPIFFIHGAEDNFVPFRMSIDMYERKPGPKKLFLADGANHSECFFEDPVEYRHQLYEFLDQIME